MFDVRREYAKVEALDRVIRAQVVDLYRQLVPGRMYLVVPAARHPHTAAAPPSFHGVFERITPHGGNGSISSTTAAEWATPPPPTDQVSLATALPALPRLVFTKAEEGGVVILSPCLVAVYPVHPNNMLPFAYQGVRDGLASAAAQNSRSESGSAILPQVASYLGTRTAGTALFTAPPPPP